MVKVNLEGKTPSNGHRTSSGALSLLLGRGMKPRPATKRAAPPWNPLERLPVTGHGAYSPLVKVCGLTNWLDYTLACEMGADYAGFIFCEKSPRFIDPAAARNLLRKRKISTVRVGVFVNEKISRVKDIYEYVGLDIVQLQGDEDPAYCESLFLPYWKAIRIKDASSLDEMMRFGCDTFLLDSFSKDSYGGTGKSIARATLQKALESGKRIIIAGGVSVLNIEEIFQMRPFGVDVCSSVEEYPGRKSAQKMRDFFHKINELRGLK